jgi:hypothetical protein
MKTVLVLLLAGWALVCDAQVKGAERREALVERLRTSAGALRWRGEEGRRPCQPFCVNAVLISLPPTCVLTPDAGRSRGA